MRLSNAASKETTRRFQENDVDQPASCRNMAADSGGPNTHSLQRTREAHQSTRRRTHTHGGYIVDVSDVHRCERAQLLHFRFRPFRLTLRAVVHASFCVRVWVCARGESCEHQTCNRSYRIKSKTKSCACANVRHHILRHSTSVYPLHFRLTTMKSETICNSRSLAVSHTLVTLSMHVLSKCGLLVSRLCERNKV